MATTPKFGFRYPASTDPPDGAGAFANLAADVENQVVDVSNYSTPAIVNNGSIAPYTAGNYTRARRAFGTVHFNLGAYMNGFTVTAGSTIATLPAGFRPLLQVSFAAISLPSGGAAYMTVETDGTIRWQAGTNPGTGGTLVGAASFAVT